MRSVLPVLLGLALCARLGAQQPDVPARLTLDDALRIAAERSPQIALAEHAVAAVAADVTGAGMWPNPVFEFSSEGLSFSRSSGAPFFDKQELILSVTQEFETGGRRGLRTEAAERSVDAVREALRDARRRLRFDVQRAYMQVALANADDEVARATLADIDKVLEVNRARYEQGELSGVELRRLQVERYRFADEAFSTELALRNARGTLLALLNTRPLDRPFEIVDALQAEGEDRPDTLRFDAADSAERALAARPDVVAARRELDRSDAALRLQGVLGKPTFSVGAGYVRDFGANGLVLSFGMPLPLFDRNQSGLGRAAAEKRQAEVRAEAVRMQVSLEVQEAVNAVDVAERRLRYVEREYLTQAREARDITLNAYRSGAATLIDYLDAERTLREALRTRNRVWFDYRVSTFQYEAAVGRPAGPSTEEQP